MRERQQQRSTVLVVVSHVEVALHGGLEHGVCCAGHHVGLPIQLHGGVGGELEVHDDVVHDVGEGGQVNAVTAAV